MDTTGSGEKIVEKHLEKYLTPLGVWALSFGSAVGWGLL